jgi:predicted peptidase
MPRPSERLFLALACLVLAGTAPGTALRATPPSADRLAGQEQISVHSPGVHNAVLRQADGAMVPYAIWIPQGYSSANPVPLVLALHFGGEPRGAGRSMLQLLVRPALGELGAIVVAPDSIAGRWDSAQNEAAVSALLSAVEHTYNIDPKRRVVMGFSMGGAGTWYWGEKHPERFSAAIPIAGRPSGPASSWRLPVFAIHSRDDQVVPIGPTAERIAELKARGLNAQLLEVQGISHYETNRFAPSLEKAVPWLLDVWRSGK